MSWSWLRLATFPVMLTAGILLIPVVEDYSDHEAATRVLSDAPMRWAAGHLIAAAAFGVAACALALYLPLIGQLRNAPAASA